VVLLHATLPAAAEADGHQPMSGGPSTTGGSAATGTTFGGWSRSRNEPEQTMSGLSMSRPQAGQM
jgi:hypothetical protein